MFFKLKNINILNFDFKIFSSRNDYKKYYLDALIIILICVIGSVYTHQIPQIVDIGLYDESSYLSYGLHIFTTFPGAEAGPLYAFWYKFLLLFEKSPIKLYYLNYRIMLIAPSIGLFYVLRSLSVNRIYSIALAFWFLTMPSNFYIWPKVSHFALTLIFLGLGMLSLLKKRISKSALLIVIFLLVSYVRPEYFITYLLFLFTFIFLEAQNIFKYKIYNPRLISIILLCSTLIIYKYGIPITSGDRSMLAFGQHYSLNLSKNNPKLINPWTNWEEIIKNDFGNVNTVFSAAIQNPQAFFSHVLVNIKQSCLHFCSTFLQTFPRSSSGNLQLSQVLLNILGVLFFSLSIFLYSSRSLILNQEKNFLKISFLKYHGDKIYALLLILVPCIISSLIIFPRDHYLMLGGTVSLAMLVGIFLNNTSNIDLNSREIILLFCAFSLLIIRPISIPVQLDSQPNLKTIEFLKSQKFNSQVNILEAEGGINIYLGDNFKRIAEYDKKDPWPVFLNDNKINLILISNRLDLDSRFSGDEYWKIFINNPEKFGFRTLKIPSLQDRKIIYKSDLINIDNNNT